MKSSDEKVSKCRLKMYSKMRILSGSYVYVLLFHINGNENNLFIAIGVKLLNLHTGVW